jgi:pimeloyl-ACP methyl ester carboxylesterase
MITSSVAKPIENKLGRQRDWVWRGYQIRYTYLRSPQEKPNGLPLIFLHGFGSALGQWRGNLVPISQHHTIYALDFLGFGASEKAPEHYRVSLWADLVHDFWRSFVGEPAVIVGHSLGSLIALTAVTKYPEMAKGLALLTLPEAQTRQPPVWARTIERFFSSPFLLWPLFQIVRQPKFLRFVLKQIYHRDELVDEELVELFAAPTRDRGVLEVFYRLALTRNDPEYSPNVKELLMSLDTPTLLLWGDKDNIVPFSGAKRVTELNPDVELKVISQGSHVAYDEQPEFVNQAILQWIETTLRDR